MSSSSSSYTGGSASQLLLNKINDFAFSNGPILIFAIYTAIFIAVMIEQPSIVITKQYTLTVVFALIFLFIAGYTIRILHSQRSMIIAMWTIVVTFAIGGMYYITPSLQDRDVVFISLLINSLLVLIILGGLAILFFMYQNSLKKLTGWPGIFVHLIFFIPCLYGEIIDRVLFDIHSTPRLVYVLFLFEILLIALFYAVPAIIAKFNGNAKTLLKVNDGVFLNEPKVVGNANDLDIVHTDGSISSYALSFWVYPNIATSAPTKPQQVIGLGYGEHEKKI